MARHKENSIVKGAKDRALIVTFLSNTPGEHVVKDVAAGTRLSGQSCGQLLKHMAETGLIPKPRVDGVKRFYRWEGEPPTPEQLAQLPDVLSQKSSTNEPIVRRPRTSKQPKEIEIVINGTQIVVGRNEATGRFRIILEDIA